MAKIVQRKTTMRVVAWVGGGVVRSRSSSTCSAAGKNLFKQLLTFKSGCTGALVRVDQVAAGSVVLAGARQALVKVVVAMIPGETRSGTDSIKLNYELFINIRLYS